MAMMKVPAKRGIALLITLIFMSVMVAFGLTLASLAYKQSVLSTEAVQSGNAFYAADGALECALYADEQQGRFDYGSYSAINLPDGSIIATDCNGSVYGIPTSPTWNATRMTIGPERISFNGGASCADIVIYKYAAPFSGRTAYFFSTGYSVSCSTLASLGGGPLLRNVVARGIDAQY